ncbi:SOS response-associated peptidase [Labrys monachus]|uniref:Abasic site processing protein n=1 Tax=Labrys monachus TaxID=217067 RepID=A0ABU0FFK4_9HYPH|nr:SOS response-associated peptidase [Labrys monachus]MDQ0393241.1 putative SOS response-associated peptidase YedK [Labrys monachus]
MCGRIRQSGPGLPGLISEPGTAEEDLARAWRAHHNGAPAQWLWVIRREPGTGRNVHDLLQWGLLPHWVKDPHGIQRSINARCEGIQSKVTFKAAYRSRRCLVPVDMFFEWMKTAGGGKPSKGPRQPYAIAMADRSKFALAGLWESWTDKATSQVTRSFAIVTCPANSLVGQIHDRMPVIVAPGDHERWLANIEPDPADLMAPYPPGLMEMWPISSKVGNPRYNEADIADPI